MDFVCDAAFSKKKRKGKKRGKKRKEKKWVDTKPTPITGGRGEGGGKGGDLN